MAEDYQELEDALQISIRVMKDVVESCIPIIFRGKFCERESIPQYLLRFGVQSPFS